MGHSLKTVYCTACSTQTGQNKKSVSHEGLSLDKDCLKPTKKVYSTKGKGKENESKRRIVGYVAVLKCPVKNRNISVFVEKTLAREILELKTEEEELAYLKEYEEKNNPSANLSSTKQAPDSTDNAHQQD
jgi:hypothetical protein